MQKKAARLRASDLEVCELLGNPKVFADLFNGSLFDGQQVINAEILKSCSEKQTIELPTESGRTQIVKRIRDIKKTADLDETKLSVILAVEGQRAVNYGMVVRNMLYDAMDYTKQIQFLKQEHKHQKNLKSSAEYLSGLSKSDRLKPVLTIVFYYGEEQLWDGSVCLHELLDFPEKLLPWKNCFPNYPLNLVSSSNVDYHNFKTGLREVFELLRVSQDKDSMEKLLEEKKEHYSSLDEDRSELVAVFLDIPLLREKKRYINSKEGGVNVCTAIREMVQEGERRGEKRGEIRGERRGEKRGEIRGEKRGEKRGEERGIRKGEENYNQLLCLLLRDKRIEDIRRITEDSSFRKQMYREYDIRK